MSIFGNLFGSKPPQSTPVDEARKLIDRFTTATIMGVDREDVGRYPAKQRKAMAFHLGAIEQLAGEFELDDARQLGIFVFFIDKYFNMPVTETGSISQLLHGFHANEDEHEYLEAGRQVFRQWHKEGDRRAPLKLGEMLKQT